jgi:site-specific DNA-methyltransferase (cytosine-N4-specific)
LAQGLSDVKRNGARTRAAGREGPPRFEELYTTALGRAVVARSEEYLATLPDRSVDLVFTSPPFALLREKDYGNAAQDDWVDWLASFGPPVRRVLAETGSFVLDLGGAYQRGRPVRSLCNYRVLLRLCDECGFFLAEEFFWHNPAKLPSPIEWVNKRKIRAKDSVNTLWWLSKTPRPKADVRNVLAPYSPRMRRLLADPARILQPKRRPSGHDISGEFAADNGGAIPSTLLCYPNTESNSLYLRLCKRHGLRPHPARFPEALPEFFVRFLTEPGDRVLDVFAGSNTTGAVAERLGRRWLAVDCERDYVLSSAFRFLEGWPDEAVADFVQRAGRRQERPVQLGVGAASRAAPGRPHAAAGPDTAAATGRPGSARRAYRG